MGQSINAKELKEIEDNFRNHKSESFMILLFITFVSIYLYCYSLYTPI